MALLTMSAAQAPAAPKLQTKAKYAIRFITTDSTLSAPEIQRASYSRHGRPARYASRCAWNLVAKFRSPAASANASA